MTMIKRLALGATFFGAVITGTPAHAATAPVYVHMNGVNMFLEGVVAVRPGQKVVFVNEDTGEHTIVGYDPMTGAASKSFNGLVTGTKGAGDKVALYSISFANPGLQYYYCSVHALLKEQIADNFAPKVRPNVDGFGDPMAGLIIVTTDKKLLAENPKTASEKILPNYFGG